jgi:hypothetical protein
VTGEAAQSSRIRVRTPLRFHRNRAYERFQRTARIVVCPSSPAFAFAFRLLFPYGLSDISRSIGEALSNDTHKGALGALDIIYAEPDAIAIAKIELAQIAMQMTLAAMLIDTFHAALEHAVEIFDGVCMGRAANVFIRFVTDALVACKMITEREIMAAFIGHHRGFLSDIGLDDRDYIGCAGSLDMERANLPAVAINERKHRILVAVTATLDRAFLPANESFICFYNFAFASHRRNADGPHGFANALAHKPSGFESYAKCAVKLVA